MERSSKIKAKVGIRREDKNKWERRTPLIPEHVKELKEKHGIQISLQPSKIRIFPDEEYLKAGAKIEEDLFSCPIVLAVKEIPLDFFKPQKTYIFFSHTVKGQSQNMPMLKKILELGCQLIDYEKVVDEKGRRLIFFGKHAGLAGMIDSLWALGKRLDWEKIENPFSKIQLAHQYQDLNQARKHITEIGDKIKTDGLPQALVPFVCGLVGYGNVSQGAQEIFDLLPVKEISPQEISSIAKDKNILYKVVFKEEDLVEPILPQDRFELKDYYDNPQKYRSRFESYIPHLNLLVNCIYWEGRYPRLITKKYLRNLYEKNKNSRLKVIGDISCDVEGSIECTMRTTDSGNPIYVYNPLTEQTTDGWKGEGVIILAVDNLPCELSKEASIDFSQALKDFIPQIAEADFSISFEKCQLPAPIKNAVVVYQGELTPNYCCLKKFI